MSDKYRIGFQSLVHPMPAWSPLHDDNMRPMEFDTEAEAIAEHERQCNWWHGVYDFIIIPPYAAPAITHEDDLTTQAGSPPRGADDDLLGLP